MELSKNGFHSRYMWMVRLTEAHAPGKSESWIDLVRSRLALRRAEKPATKAGHIRALWPEIEAALTGGQSMKSIRKWLEEDAGITLGITTLTSYISRRRRQTVKSCIGVPIMESVRSTKAERIPAPGSARRTQPDAASPSESPADPLAHATRALSKPRFDIRECHGDGDPQGRNLI